MADELIPPQYAGNKNPSDEKPGEKSTTDGDKHVMPANMDEAATSKPALTVIGVTLGLIEASAFAFWHISEILHGYSWFTIRWAFYVCLFAGPFFAIHVLLKRKSWFVWCVFVAVCVTFGIVTFNNIPVATNDKLKPVEQRLRGFLEAMDTRAIAELAKRRRDLDCVAILETSQAADLRKLSVEPRAEKFITLLPPEGTDSVWGITDKGITTTTIRFRLSTNLLTKQ